MIPITWDKSQKKKKKEKYNMQKKSDTVTHDRKL